MIEMTRSILKKRFLTLKNFLWLFIMFAFLQYLDEILETWGFEIETSLLEYGFDGIQIFFFGLGIYIFLYFMEKNVQNAFLKDSFLRAVIENMDEGVSVCDKDGNLVFMNETYAHRMNHDKLSYPIPYEEWGQYMEVYEENGKSQIKPEDFPLIRVLRGEEVKQQVIVVKTTGKPIQYVSVNGKKITSKYDEQIGALVVIRDITEQKQAEERIKHMAYHDKLTGLPNLRFFKEKVDHFITEGIKNQGNALFTVMFIDLDGFKNVNDYFGHDIGDLLLIEVSKRITSCLRENDIVSRIGGDEFTIMLPKINSVEG